MYKYSVKYLSLDIFLIIVKEPYMQQLKVFLKEAAHQELLPTIRRSVDILLLFILTDQSMSVCASV